MSRSTQGSSAQLSIRGYPPLWPAFPCRSDRRTKDHWPDPLSLATTYGVSVDVLSSGYLDVSVHRVRLSWLCIHQKIPPKRWVAPFGNPWIKAYSQLPTAYRSVSRPSSPPDAKASTRCPSLAREIRRHVQNRTRDPFALLQTGAVILRGSDARPLSSHTSDDLISSHCQRTSPVIQKDPGSRIGNPIPASRSEERGRNLLASCIERHFAACFQGKPGRWWARVDSNHRPHAYQACALTT